MTIKGHDVKNPPSKGMSHKGPVKKGSGGGGAKGKKGGGPKRGARYGAMGGYKGVRRKEAANIIDGQINELRRLLTQQGKNARTDYTRQRDDMQKVFDEVKGYTGAQDEKIAGQYGAAGQALQGINQSTQQSMQQSASGIKDAAQAELMRMGISPATGAMGNYDGDSANALAMMQLQGGNEQKNLALSKAGSDSVSGVLSGMLSGSQMSNMGRIQNDLNDQLTDIRAQKRDAWGQRGSQINDLLMQLNESRFNQWLGLQNLRMDRKSMKHGFAMDRAGALQDASYAGTLSGLYSNAYNNPSSPTGPGNGGNPRRRTPKPSPLTPKQRSMLGIFGGQ